MVTIHASMGVNEIATPQFHIEVTSSDGVIVSPDPEGIDLDGVGAARALVVETLVGFTQEQPLPGMTRTITVITRDKNGGVCRDSATVQGRPLPEPADPDLWRAMAAMNRNA